MHCNSTYTTHRAIMMTGTKLSVAQVVLLLLLAMYHDTALAINIVFTSPLQNTGDQPNTFIATSDQIASSLLGSGVPSIMYGIMGSGDVTTVCQQIVDTGGLNFDVTVIDSISGVQEDIIIQIEATGGCQAAADESGTEAVFVDNYGRRSALVCPGNAGASGCGVYLTGDDVTALYNQGGGRRRLLTAASRKLLDCQANVGKGAISGTICGLLDSTAGCLTTGPLFIFCLIGAVGVQAEIGAAAGCAVGAACFPGDATVQIADGEVKYMADLGLGDKVAVRNLEGGISFEEIYAFGHKDATTTSEFLTISMIPQGVNMSEGKETRFLELSGLHFAPVSTGKGGPDFVHKRARDIKEGDIMWASTGKARAYQALAPYIVTDISTTVKQGLYNPFTVSGTIVVNGIVASVHSEWFLDGLFDALSLTHLLPTVYQVVLAPARLLYTILGKSLYISVYTWLDSHIGFVEIVSDHARGAMAVSAAGAVVASFLSLSTKKQKWT